MNFAGKVVLITGASSGIGAETAVYLSSLGASLAITGRNATNLQRTVDECRKASAGGNQPFTVTGDLSVEKDVENIFKETIKKYGRLDVLVNNAGILGTGSIENSTLAQFDLMINTNVRAVLQLTQLALPYLIESKGNVVNVSSVNGIRSFPGVLAYNISKAALDQLTRCVALELGSREVRVNSVNPGVIITELQKRGGLDDEAYAKFLERSKETHALGRPGKTREVAATIAFLASDLASNITGVTLPVDGGRHAMCPR